MESSEGFNQFIKYKYTDIEVAKVLQILELLSGGDILDRFMYIIEDVFSYSESFDLLADCTTRDYIDAFMSLLETNDKVNIVKKSLKYFKYLIGDIVAAFSFLNAIYEHKESGNKAMIGNTPMVDYLLKSDNTSMLISPNDPVSYANTVYFYVAALHFTIDYEKGELSDPKNAALLIFHEYLSSKARRLVPYYGFAFSKLVTKIAKQLTTVEPDFGEIFIPVLEVLEPEVYVRLSNAVANMD